MKKIVYGLSLGVLLFCTSGFAAEYKWGAISLDTSDLNVNGGFGIGGGDTEQEAKDNAQKFCGEDGAKGCSVVTTYKKCGSVAVKKSGKGGAWGIDDTKDAASARALTQCGGEDVCKVVVTDCN